MSVQRVFPRTEKQITSPSSHENVRGHLNLTRTPNQQEPVCLHHVVRTVIWDQNRYLPFLLVLKSMKNLPRVKEMDRITKSKSRCLKCCFFFPKRHGVFIFAINLVLWVGEM